MEFDEHFKGKAEKTMKEKVKRVQELGLIKMCDASREEHEEYWRLLEEITDEALAKIREKEDGISH